MKLLEHNAITLRQLEDYTLHGKNCCVVNPCGSGKTSVISEYISHNLDKRIILFTKQRNAKQYYIEKNSVFNAVKIITYSMMYKDYQNKRFDIYNADIYIMDEAHYIGAENWNKALEFLIDKYTPIIIGVTATPQRYADQGTDSTIITRFFDGNFAGGYTTKQLQKMGVFIEPEYILSLYNLEEEIGGRLDKIEDTDLPDEQKRKYQQRLYDIYTDWQKNSCPQIVLKEALPKYMYKKSSNKILVYMPSVAEIDERREEIDELIRGVFPGKKLVSYRYTHIDSEKEYTDFLIEDDNYIKVLYSVDKIMETIHIDDLSIVLMLRPSVSNRIITQQFGRINSIGNNKKSLIVDMVGNLSNINSVNFLGGEYYGYNEKSKKNFNLSYITKYKSLFDAIDSAFVKTIYYTYDGVTDTLYNLCKIFNKDYHTVKTYVKDVGMTINEAFQKAKTLKSNMSQEIFDGIRTIPDINKTTDEKRALIEKHIKTVDNFIKRHGIEDEDLKQDLYIEMMYRISKRDFNSANETAMIINYLKAYYTKARRIDTMHKNLWADKSLSELNLIYDNRLEDKTFAKSITKNMSSVMDTLTDREKGALLVRFGFNDGKCLTLEDAGKVFGVTRERLRQIEAKALRKLRDPKRFALLGIDSSREAECLLSGISDDMLIYEANKEKAKGKGVRTTKLPGPAQDIDERLREYKPNTRYPLQEYAKYLDITISNCKAKLSFYSDKAMWSEAKTTEKLMEKSLEALSIIRNMNIQFKYAFDRGYAGERVAIGTKMAKKLKEIMDNPEGIYKEALTFAETWNL